MRAFLLYEIGVFGNAPAVAADARAIADKYINDPASVDASLGNMALYVAARGGDAALFERIQHLYLSTGNPNLKAVALNVLSNFSSSELIARALDFDTSDQVRNQDAVFAIIQPLYKDSTRDVGWSYVKTNWDKVHSQLTESNGGALVQAAGNFCSAAARKDVEEFFGTHKVAASSTTLKHSLENIDNCIEFRSLQEPQLKTWLDTQPKF